MGSYKRVLPRDAFKDAKLLKCIGQLTLLIENKAACVEGLTFDYDGEAFDIQQDDSDGSTYVSNIQFFVNKKPVRMRGALNSRDAWPIVMQAQDTDEDYYVISERKELVTMIQALHEAYGAGWRAGMAGEQDYTAANPFIRKNQSIRAFIWQWGWINSTLKGRK